MAILGYMTVLIYQRRQYALGHPWQPPPFQNAINISEAECAHQPNNNPPMTQSEGSRLEPPTGTFWFGFDLQWDRDSPDKLVERLGLRPAVFNTFINLNETDFERDIINWQAQLASFHGAVLEITLVPNDNRPDRAAPLDIKDIPDDTYYAVAMQMRYINSLYGTPVLLRFGHEMNGDWLIAFSQRPIEYLHAYRTLANYVHTLTNLTAMVWAPNIGSNYPWGGGTRAHDANFQLMDTNRDGTLTNADDPYLPYWPGPDYVDWIGLSLYQYDYDQETNQVAVLNDATTHFRTSFQGAVVSPTWGDVQDLYRRFAKVHNKPFMLAETGAAFVSPNATAQVKSLGSSTADNTRNMEAKRAWWRGIATMAQSDEFHNFKLAVWFEEKKFEQAAWQASLQVEKDYHITYDDFIKQEFLNDVKGQYKDLITWGGQYKWNCAGVVTRNETGSK
ncbi:hypothetical protein HK104_001354 [Borealophlyctis nickersoniae]|nr:hypothetical protein HK104_001354 [Borealophlyctis nickersoniae]